MAARPDDLLLLLEVARFGSFAAAGAALAMDHSTISRRITSLERDLGGPVVIRAAGGATLTELGRNLLDSAERIERTMAAVSELARAPGFEPTALTGMVRIAAPDAFGACFVAPVIARLHRAHPAVRLELVTATRPLVQGIGSDIEIGVGQPTSPRLETLLLTRYSLGLWAAPEYLAAKGTPESVAGLADHSLVYYVDSLLRVDDLALLRELFPAGSAEVGSTNVHAQVQAALAGGGIGLLPNFLAGREAGLRRVLAGQVDIVLQFRVALAPRVLRRPASTAVLRALQAEVAARQAELLPGHRPD
ncbi:LysR family transcriptional regulator [Nakamurella sp. YIM 132087]|uniref:LysR family transcriptional regulator n=1 Tax=Nakamurella alba TaxID=2665158 RepID=A0A7K1FSH8_9ACTN|nr:LysR family transcriptional regulator [Nakamurella alba]MTD16349.1 LysR family transcriptional regulator [Nakamurella alba]